MLYLPLPPVPEQTFDYCVALAEEKYQVPACILRAVHEIESGGDLRPGLVHPNSNGTKDYGVTQINTVWANYFQRKFGIPATALADNACLAVNGSAYIIRYEINATGSLWAGVGNYHSRTPGEHDRYVWRVARAVGRYGCQIK
ncbi:lytic transglycosylase domain-containing protein [Trinickia fusca]|uniref:Lytic transglycosylase n=1 Tax=Trinickia fusca TaxID=2419777 RepID=A0A494XAL2_9BURK|nr:lytic transglycosylase domain-containing protein [Trinickia fusca]RKP47540.1 lytic transglycosylase [Trinickia fusca]